VPPPSTLRTFWIETLDVAGLGIKPSTSPRWPTYVDDAFSIRLLASCAQRSIPLYRLPTLINPAISKRDFFPTNPASSCVDCCARHNALRREGSEQLLPSLERQSTIKTEYGETSPLLSKPSDRGEIVVGCHAAFLRGILLTCISRSTNLFANPHYYIESFTQNSPAVDESTFGVLRPPRR
jgi:hypothetical protein